jgi:hypothetical protein
MAQVWRGAARETKPLCGGKPLVAGTIGHVRCLKNLELMRAMTEPRAADNFAVVAEFMATQIHQETELG